MASTDGQNIPLKAINKATTPYGNSVYFFETNEDLKPNQQYTISYQYNGQGQTPLQYQFTTSTNKDLTPPTLDKINSVNITYHANGEALSYIGSFGCDSRGEILAGNFDPNSPSNLGRTYQPMPEHYHITITLGSIQDSSGVVLATTSEISTEGTKTTSTFINTPTSGANFQFLVDKIPTSNKMTYGFQMEDIFGTQWLQLLAIDVLLNKTNSTYQIGQGTIDVLPLPSPSPLPSSPAPAAGCNLILISP